MSIKLNDKVKIGTVLAVAGCLFCALSIVNHLMFKTFALDLGLYNHALFDYSHLRIDDCSMFKANPQYILSDHFDLYLIILSPLVFLFGNFTLLFVQVAAVVLGGLGIYRLMRLYVDDGFLPLMATIVFFSFFGIWHALSFDYHSNVVASMMLPWLFYYFKRKKFGWATLFAFLFVIGKENMSLWLSFIALGLMWDYRKERTSLLVLACYAVFSLIYFYVVNSIVMPALGGSGGGFQRYAYLGNSYAEIASNLLQNPLESIKLLFVNTSGNVSKNGLKLEFYICALTSGLLLTCLKPNYLFMLIPIVAQKMLASDSMFWGVTQQYSVEFAPIVTVASFIVIARIRKPIGAKAASMGLFAASVVTLFYTVGTPKSYFSPDKLRIYQKHHYQQAYFSPEDARKLISQIPDEASVCATSVFVPHLALRDEIYDFPIGMNHNPEYCLLVRDFNRYSEQNRELVRQMLDEQEDYEIISSAENLYLLKRRQ